MNSAGHQKDIPNTYRKQYFVKTKEFGNAEREVSIEYLCYNKDSNKPTSKIDNVCRISFGFSEFKQDSLSNGGWESLKEDISRKFDSSWKKVEFDLEDIENKKDEEMRDYLLM